MRLEIRKLLYDLGCAADKLARFVVGKTFADYENDDLLRSGVERQFEIMGEAIGKLAKIDLNVVSKITDYRQIIAFRNILIHGYADIDDRLVWNIVETKLPKLAREIASLSSGE